MIRMEAIYSDILYEAEKIQCIPAPTFFEFNRAAYIKKRFLEIGLTNVEIDSVGNVIGYAIGSKPEQKPIIISAHMDTVHAKDVNHQLIKQGEKWIGAGIGDNTIALAVLINLAKFFINNPTPRTIIFCANICEEGLGNLIGIKALVDKFKNSPLFYLVLEGMGLGVIFNRGLGVKRFEITVKTNGGHSWGSFGEPSAIHEIAKFINNFSIDDLSKTVRSTYNFGTINGGTTINSIAQEATTELDIRSENQMILNQIEKKLFNLKQKMETPKVRFYINRIGERPYGALSNSHWLVKLAENALRKLEIEPVFVIGSTDANYPLSLGYPAICVCLTKGGNVHTPEEFIFLDPIKKGFIQIIEIIQNAKET
ncbi:MAG: hypothetical protein CL609_12725 [Anaerolineaceae bacterium]|nr:hypothetical protein [Anaerolineaceae bacterium]